MNQRSGILKRGGRKFLALIRMLWGAPLFAFDWCNQLSVGKYMEGVLIFTLFHVRNSLSDSMQGVRFYPWRSNIPPCLTPVPHFSVVGQN